MENLNLSPFYPGQKVVALKDSKQVNCKKGMILTIVACFKNNCKCNKSGWEIAVKEFPGTSDFSFCACHKTIIRHDGYIYFLGDAHYFAPLEEKFEHISLSKVIEIETCLVSEN